MASLLAFTALGATAPSARGQDTPGVPTGRIADTPLPKLEVQRAQGAEACAGATALADDLQQMVGRPAVDAEPGPGDGYRIDIARAAEGFEAVVRRRGEATGERRIVDPDPTCQGLRETVSLAMAVILDEPPRTAEGPGPPRVPLTPPPSPPPPDRLEPAAPWLGAATAGAMASYQLVDSVWPVLFAELQLRPLPRWSLSAGVLWTPDESIDVGTAEVEVGLLAGSARGCGDFRVEAPRISGCLDLAIGQLRGEGAGFGQGAGDNGVARTFWMAGGASLDASGPVYGPIGWTARLGVWVPVRRQYFDVITWQSDLVPGSYETPPVGGVLGAGLQAAIF